MARKSHGAAFAALDGRSGELSAKPYAGELEIYKRGFVTVAKGAKHFTGLGGDTPREILVKRHFEVVGGMVGGCAWGGNGPYFMFSQSG